MALLSDLRAFLQRVRERRVAVLPDASVIDVQALRRQAIARVAGEEPWKWPVNALLGRGDELVTDLAIELQAEVGVTEPAALAQLLTPAWRMLLDHELRLDPLREEPGEVGAAIQLVLPPEEVSMPVHGPRPRLVMALVNLLRNALQAGGEGVQIRATLAAAEGHQATLAIDDSGPGIPESDRHKLFTSGHTTSTDGSGSGLGLALVREVVEVEFYGSVTLDPSPSPLGGARFTLRFPLRGVL